MIRANEVGIKADADIEFLHEYRVAVRRTRSALSQIRNVFPSEKTEHFKREFQTLGRRTNDLRNLDVFLTTETGYRAKLPGDMREDIAPLFDYLRSRRSEALALVVAGFESESYSQFLDEWDCFLQQPIGENDPGNALAPIIKLARGRIDRQYRNIVRDGAYALEHTEDKLLHALRIECKKLRYLLEFFAGLFPPEDVAPLLKALKRLQDNLGALADLSDQRDYLLSIAEMLDIDRARARRALVATGFLVENIAREQQSMRANFSGIFESFASPAHQRHFQKLTGRRKRG
jgi:CHAD domain-containing protein